MKLKIFTICCLVIIFPVREFAQSTQSPERSMISVTRKIVVSPIRKKPNKQQKKQLQPKTEDLSKYSQFLLQPKTGMFRLLPDPGCEDNALVVRVDEICRNAIPESFSYSFREEEHTAEILADIRLKNEFLISDGLLSQGILVNLGNIPVETVTLETEGLGFLKDYAPPVLSKEARAAFLRIIEGVKAGKHEYKVALKAVENSTYGLRVVAYRGSIFQTYRGFLYDLLAGDKRIDLTLAFRIIRKETDGSLTLLWKELQRKESPKLKRPKKERENKS